jgi:acetolactate synthase-1/2/3 large subunit
VVIAGRATQRDPGPLVRLSERFGLGVYTAFRRQDAFPNSHPHYLGHLTLNAASELLEPLRRADLVVVAGGRLDEVTTQSYTLPLPGTRLVAVDPAAEVTGAEFPVRTTVPAFVEAALRAGGDGASHDLVAPHATYLRHSSTPGDVESAPGTVHPTAVVETMRRRLPTDTVLVNDDGNFSIFCHRYWRFDHPASQLGPASGAMGYAVPGAVAARLAAPGRRVVALAGDGGFLMTGSELETAVRHGLAITVLVFVNRRYGTIALHQARHTGHLAGVDIGAVDVAGYARALGADAADVRSAADLDAALSPPDGRPKVLAVRTDPDVLSPDARLSDLL